MSSSLTALAASLPGLLPLDVPVGWSEPDPVNMVHALLLLAGVPILLFVAVVVMVYIPSLIRGERIAPGAAPVGNQWLGGPRRGTAELAGPDDDDSQAGGASGRW